MFLRAFFYVILNKMAHFFVFGRVLNMFASRAIVSTDAKRARTEIREKICRKSFDLRDREGDLTLDLKFKYRGVYGTRFLVRTR